MINQEVIVNQHLEEQVMLEHPDFPLGRFIDQLDYFVDGSFLCHWHTNFELAIILEGSVEYILDQQPFSLEKGMGLFINSQTMHSARQLIPGSVIFNISFPPSLFNTVLATSLYQKYFNPLSLRKISGQMISGDTAEGREILEAFWHIHEADPEEFTYELTCMENILHIWRNLLFLINQSEPEIYTYNDMLREQRMHRMIEFIQTHIDAPLTVEDISAAANISRSECFRCFSLFGQTTPMGYTNRYRLQCAAQKLAHSNERISDICFSCGFSSISYFGKSFHKAYGVTPSAYRKHPPGA